MQKPFVAHQSRLNVIFLTTFSFLAIAYFIFFSNSFLGYRKIPTDSWNNDKGRGQSGPPSRRIYNCADPYRVPGYLYVDHDNYRNTQWIPFTSELLGAPDPESAKYPPDLNPDVYFNLTPVDQEFLDSPSTPKKWMNIAVAEAARRRTVMKKAKEVDDYVDLKNEGGMGWLWGRRVLIIADSVDRFMIRYFCEEFAGAFSQPKIHGNSFCEIPSFNLTLVHWHSAGTPTFHPKWWWDAPIKDVPFELRWGKEWSPSIETHGLRGLDGKGPDLIMWQGGLWDRSNFVKAGQAHFDKDHIMGQQDRQLVWEEMRFLVARYKKFVGMIKEEFGPDVHTMFRSLTMDRDMDVGEVQLLEMDRVERAVAEWAGHEVFEWGRIMNAFTMLYKDLRHVAKGPGSWLYGNMLLEYMARIAGVGDPDGAPYFDGWDACHEQLIYPGER